jgi:hypothetical protein
MPADPSEHWLWRLDAAAWLRAAATELTTGSDNLAARRTAVTHARRAAGMALNAVLVALVTADEHRWGRSYIDHLRALADPQVAIDPLPPEARPLAAALLKIPVVGTATTLIQLGRTPHSAAEQALDLARALVGHCTDCIAALPARPRA